MVVDSPRTHHEVWPKLNLRHELCIDTEGSSKHILVIIILERLTKRHGHA